MNTRLYLEFLDTVGKTTSLTVDEPKENLTSEEVIQAMTNIITSNAIDSKGNDIESISQAYTVTETINQLV